VGGPGLIHVGCWAHARRKFVDAVKVNPKDGAAIAMVTRMDALFLVDRQRARRGRQLHLKYVGQAAPLLGLPRGGTVQQRRGEFDAAGGAGPEELATRAQREVRPEGRGNSFGGAVLPQAWHSGERLSAHCSARYEPEKAFRSR
jgi:hypothetical protein